MSGSNRIRVKQTAVQLIRVYLKFSTDVQAVLRALVQYGLESADHRVVQETILAIPIIFPPDFDTRYIKIFLRMFRCVNHETKCHVTGLTEKSR